MACLEHASSLVCSFLRTGWEDLRHAMSRQCSGSITCLTPQAMSSFSSLGGGDLLMPNWQEKRGKFEHSSELRGCCVLGSSWEN